MTAPSRIRIGIAAGVAALFAAQPALAQKVDGPQVNWKMATWGKSRAFTSGIEKIRDYVKEKTGGKFNITIGYSTFGGEREILDILSAGGLQATTICSSYHPHKHPAYTGLDLPFLPLPTADVQWAVHDAYHKHPYIIEEMGKWNAMFYSSNLLPQYEFIGKGKPPKSLDDFKGMRVRAIGGIGAAMKNLGAVPTSVPATEVYTSMDRGTVDAASFPSTYAHGSYKIHEVGDWFTTNLSPGTQACPTLINKDAWAKLPKQYQKLIEEVRPQVKETLKAAYKKADDKNIPLFKKKLTFVTYSEDELDQFRKLGAQPVWDAWIAEMSGKGIPAKQLFDLIMTSAKQAAKKN